MRKIRYSKHALAQMSERGACCDEVQQAIFNGEKVPAKRGRHAFRINIQFNKQWAGKLYATKQVMPIVAFEDDKIIVITVYTFYF